MNLFVLDEDPAVAAEYHCDKHVVKMILETAQILSTVHRKYGYDGDELYRKTHANHPCTVWAGESTENYRWAHDLFVALCDEYTLRYGRVHASQRLVEPLAEPPAGVSHGKLTPFAQAMPEDVRGDNAVEAYRRYYMTHKATIARWAHGPKPPWWADEFDLQLSP